MSNSSSNSRESVCIVGLIRPGAHNDCFRILRPDHGKAKSDDEDEDELL